MAGKTAVRRCWPPQRGTFGPWQTANAVAIPSAKVAYAPNVPLVVGAVRCSNKVVVPSLFELTKFVRRRQLNRDTGEER